MPTEKEVKSVKSTVIKTEYKDTATGRSVMASSYQEALELLSKLDKQEAK